MAFEVDFTLKPIDKIDKFGTEGNYSLHFFAASDSNYTYKVGDTVLLEYRDGYINDYYLERFVQDFLEIFPFISRSVSEALYETVKSDSMDFYTLISNALPDYPYSSEADERKADELFELLFYLNGCRHLDHGHLRDGLDIYFYRCDDRLLIKWECEENYKAQSGQAEFSWEEFLTDLQSFAEKYIREMTVQCEKLSCYSEDGVTVYDPFPDLEKRKDGLHRLLWDNDAPEFSVFSDEFLRSENICRSVQGILEMCK